MQRYRLVISRQRDLGFKIQDRFKKFLLKMKQKEKQQLATNLRLGDQLAKRI